MTAEDYNPKKLFEVKMLYLHVNEGISAENIKGFIEKNSDAAVFIVKNYTKFQELFPKSAKISPVSNPFTNFAVKIYRNQQEVRQPLIKCRDSKFSTLTFNIPQGQNLNMTVMIVDLTREDTTKTKEISDCWNAIRVKGPAIAIGDFNVTPSDVRYKLLEGGQTAFVDNQLFRDGDKKFTANAYANTRCELVSFYGEKIDGEDCYAFALRYACYEREGEFYGKLRFCKVGKKVEEEHEAEPRMAELSTLLQPTKTPYIKLMYLDGGGKSKPEVIFDRIRKENLDFIALINSNKKNRKPIVDRDFKDWGKYEHQFTNGSTICCLFNEQSLGKVLPFKTDEDGCFITVRVPMPGMTDKKYLKIITVEIPSDRKKKDDAQKKLQETWKEQSKLDPLIVIGDFRMRPVDIIKRLPGILFQDDRRSSLINSLLQEVGDSSKKAEEEINIDDFTVCYSFARDE